MTKNEFIIQYILIRARYDNSVQADVANAFATVREIETKEPDFFNEQML